MKNYRNNIRKNKQRNVSDRNFSRHFIQQKNDTNYINIENFRRKNPGKNNQNASRLVEKYNDLAREALSKGDKILSERYFQHAEHFTRILNDKKLNNDQILKNNSVDQKKNIVDEDVLKKT